MSTTADAARAYLAAIDAFDASADPDEDYRPMFAAAAVFTSTAGVDFGEVEAVAARLLVREVDRYEALLAAVRDVGRLSCEKIPDGVALTHDEWYRAQCGECPACRLHKAVADLDGKADWRDWHG